MEKRRPLLIVEDDPALLKQLKWSLSDYECLLASDRDQALAQVRRHAPAVVTLDLGLPPSPDAPDVGLAVLREVADVAPDTKVIVMTGQNDRANALRAIALGAYDFLSKPVEPDVLALTLERAYRLYELQQENQRLVEAQGGNALTHVITGDPEMLRLARMTEKVAAADVSVMLLGESGTGKELFARALHELSGRKRERFVAINCAAIPETLLEAELFGYERGAFTGATRQTPGKIETAHRGTLFLDEIGDLPLALQPKLLRFLQERAIERLGGRDSIAVDVRVVCATHRDPKAQIAAGELREDLYYRLAEIVLSIPPLRSRIGDPGLLAHFFLRKFSASSKRGSMSLSAGAIEAIEAHPWAGNVRELESAIKRAVIMAERNQLQASDLGLQDADGAAPVLNLQAIRERAEREAVARALGRANGNITKAAELLGVSRPTLYDLMARAGLRSAGPPADE
ncbi:MAG: PEP-CTERM-box response regulator transcription factor [Burkholderiaceae bacterium]|nr:PEP-CTERM-box response regulator transcription factor [Ideonella sp.]MCC7284773.1 PEP-CTERM-box response regulator transcription factor [Burkholderiaceae bacterium]